MQTKKHFTLIEVVVSLCLITIILTFLFGYFAQITKIEINIAKTKKKVYEKNHLLVRLNNILSQISFTDINKSPFYTKYKKKNEYLSLYFNFDNGIDPDPNYSDIIKARLFIDEKKDLCLELEPNDEKIKTKRKEILLKDINHIEFKFLSQKDLLMQKYATKKITDDFFWFDFWPEEKKSLPLVICLKINKNLDFAFFLPNKGVKI
jgi:hypothetical protein